MLRVQDGLVIRVDQARVIKGLLCLVVLAYKVQEFSTQSPCTALLSDHFILCCRYKKPNGINDLSNDGFNKFNLRK